MYVVWQRSDGLVSSSKRAGGARFPDAWTVGSMTLTVLGVFDDSDWKSAAALIAEKRLETDCPFCKTRHWADNCPDDVDDVVREARTYRRQEGLTQ